MNTSKYYLWVDDVRPINYSRMPKGYNPLIVDCYEHAIIWLKKLKVEGSKVIVDLDHDLGTEKSGYDIAKYMVENDYPRLNFHYRIHSMNPVGEENIRQLMRRYNFIESSETWKEIFEKNGAEGIDFVPLTFNKNCPQNFPIYATFDKETICNESVCYPRSNYVFWIMRNGNKIYI